MGLNIKYKTIILVGQIIRYSVRNQSREQFVDLTLKLQSTKRKTDK